MRSVSPYVSTDTRAVPIKQGNKISCCLSTNIIFILCTIINMPVEFNGVNSLASVMSIFVILLVWATFLALVSGRLLSLVVFATSLLARAIAWDGSVPCNWAGHCLASSKSAST